MDFSPRLGRAMQDLRTAHTETPETIKIWKASVKKSRIAHWCLCFEKAILKSSRPEKPDVQCKYVEIKTSIWI